MNSLTTVGGKVIESEELNSMHDQLKRTGTTTPRSASGGNSGGMSSSRGQLKKSFTSRSYASPRNGSPGANAKLSRQRSLPSPVITNDEDVDEMAIPLIPPLSTRTAELQLPPRSPTFRKKVSTPYKASAQKLDNSQVIIDLLETLSQQESFNRSSYFRGVFTRGINKAKQSTQKFESVEEALDVCFDVSDDMRKVIATKVHADEMMAKMMSPAIKGEESDDRSTNIGSTRSAGSSNRSRPWESSPRSQQKSISTQKPKPWETDGGTSTRRPSVQEYMKQIEDRIHQTYADVEKEKTGNALSVFLANNALEVEVENEKKSRSPFDEAFVSPRLVRRKGENQKDISLPFMDEALVSPRLVERKKLMDIQDSDEDAGIFSGSERLVKELELLEDRKRMGLELEKNRLDLNRQKEEIETLKDAMEEAGMTIKTLEESLRELNKATKEKDEIIGRLEGKVKEEELANAGSHMAHQEQVKELGSAVAQLNLLVKQKETESKDVSASLAEATDKYNKSEAVLKELQVAMAKKDEEHAALVKKLENERDELAKELEDSKEAMTTSMDNTKSQMDGIIKEKDKLIYSLSAKIEILESNYEEMKESKLQVDLSNASKEKELNEKIHDLATSLIEKDEQMADLEKEIEELKLSAKKVKRKDRHERQTKRRPWEDHDIDSLRSSFEEERSRRQQRKSSQRRRSHDEGREARLQKPDRVPTRVRYSTPEPYYEDERDDGYGYPEREATLLSPVDDDSYVFRPV